MKTTIDVPDSLADEAKEMARAEGTTLRDLVVTGLRYELDRRRSRAPIDFVFPTVGGLGMAPGVGAEDVIATSYGLPM